MPIQAIHFSWRLLAAMFLKHSALALAVGVSMPYINAVDAAQGVRR